MESKFKNALIDWWNFEEISKNKISNIITKQSVRIHGNYKHIEGIQGNSLKFDGFTTYIEYKPRYSFNFDTLNEFTIETWLALGAYPWNWCPIYDIQEDWQKGCFFGIDEEGHVGFFLATTSQDKSWQGIIASESLDLRKWYWLVCTVNLNNNITLHINGKNVATLDIEGKYIPASNKNVLIGKHRNELEPTRGVKDLIAWRAHFPTAIFLDGIIDELKVYNRGFSSDDVKALFHEIKGDILTKKAPSIPIRTLPSSPLHKNNFRAYYTKLSYYDEWDALWRVGQYADIVVQFDLTPYQYMFWRGTNYIPCWVTENGIWYTNEFNETWTRKTIGCCEPMSDKQCHYSNVKIIENNEARVVICWRYALIDITGQFARTDKETNWSDWSEEIHTIYPDGVNVRKITLFSSEPYAPHEWQESIVVLPPGMRPEDAINPDALSLLNMNGEKVSYSWADQAPKSIDKPEKANIEYINLKSEYKPFIIVSDAPLSDRWKGPLFNCYNEEIDRVISIFPWWNHWPVAQIPSDGRITTKADRASSSSLSHIVDWVSYEETANSLCKIMLHGLTNQSPKELIPIARSWLNPPKLKIISPSYQNEGYDQSERAFIIKNNSEIPSQKVLKLEIKSAPDSPVINPCFIIKNWTVSNIQITINGELIEREKDYRVGIRHSLKSSDTIIWINKKAEISLEIQIMEKKL